MKPYPSAPTTNDRAALAYAMLQRALSDLARTYKFSDAELGEAMAKVLLGMEHKEKDK
jgi:hypothetical protein